MAVNVAEMASGCRAGCTTAQRVDGYYVWLAMPVRRLMLGTEHVKAWGLVRTLVQGAICECGCTCCGDVVCAVGLLDNTSTAP